MNRCCPRKVHLRFLSPTLGPLYPAQSTPTTFPHPTIQLSNASIFFYHAKPRHLAPDVSSAYTCHQPPSPPRPPTHKLDNAQTCTVQPLLTTRNCFQSSLQLPETAQYGLQMLGSGDLTSNLGGRSEPSPSESTTPRVLTMLSHVIEKLVARNDKLVDGMDKKLDGMSSGLARVGKSLNVFHGVRAPNISIVKYLERLYKLLVTSVMVASKMLDDVHYNNAFYARVGGVSNAELNRLEMEFLFLLDFGVTVSSRVFESYCLHLEKEMMLNGGASQKIERAIVSNAVDDVTEISVEDTQSSSPTQGMD
ncbi:hypothetical protein OIU76_025210 [Salix suchowensis]|nr:hypothetical protein OIU76_025210 [Salix suchowensis]